MSHQAAEFRTTGRAQKFARDKSVTVPPGARDCNSKTMIIESHQYVSIKRTDTREYLEDEKISVK